MKSLAASTRFHNQGVGRGDRHVGKVALKRFQQELAERGLDAALLAAPETESPVNVRYLSGFTGSSSYLVIGREAAWLLTDFRYTEQAAREAPDFTVVQHTRPYLGSIEELVKHHGWTHLGFEADKVPYAVFREWEAAIAADWAPLGGLVERLRLVKAPEELKAIARAASIADRALAEVLPGIAGRPERDVALDLEMAMRRHGAERLAFDTIVASGVRGSLPHGHPTDKVIEPGELVTIDFGAHVSGYHSDETVTVGVGPVSSRQREIFDLVHRAQAAGIAAVRPGVRVSEVDHAARSIIAEAGYGEAFGHGLGHGVGLQVHEDPYASPTPGRDYVLEAGMTITVEPGIYLPGFGGVRLEDTLAVTETGHEYLTGFSKEWQEVPLPRR